MDRIIWFFTEPRNGIDISNKLDDVTYEESETRLIFMGLFLASTMTIVSTMLTALYFSRFSKPTTIILEPESTTDIMTFPSPYVLLMDKNGIGFMSALKQHPNLTFDLHWEFKLPKTPHDSGYFVFEDQGRIYALSSHTKQKMTALYPPSKTHVTIPKSQIPEEFHRFGTSLRIGNFVMIFGGRSQLDPECFYCDHWDWNKERDLCHLPDDQGQQPYTIIWSVKRQVWMKGPYLPIKGPECIHNPAGFAINRTHGVLLSSPVYPNYSSIHVWQHKCIEAYTYSFDTFAWVQIDRCLIRLKNEDNLMGLRDHSSLTCTTFLDKHGKL